LRTFQGSSKFLKTVEIPVISVYNMGFQAFYGTKLHLILWAGTRPHVEM